MAQLTASVQTQPQSQTSMATESANGTSHSSNDTQLILKFPRQGEWTYEHWLQFPDDGWKYEIIDGVLYTSPPPAIIHQDVSGELYVFMRIHAKQHKLGKVLEAPCGVRLPNQSAPVEPDILFVKQARIFFPSFQNRHMGREFVQTGRAA